MALTFNHSAKQISVPQVDAQPLTIQNLVNAIRDEEASERGIAYDQILDASGKETLKTGVTTGITAALRSTWAISFATGSYQATIDGGNLADALDRVVNTGSPQVLVLASAASTIVGSGSAEAVADAVLAAAQTTPIHADMRKTNGQTLIGDGTEGNKFRSSLVG